MLFSIDASLENAEAKGSIYPNAPSGENIASNAGQRLYVLTASFFN